MIKISTNKCLHNNGCFKILKTMHFALASSEDTTRVRPRKKGTLNSDQFVYLHVHLVVDGQLLPLLDLLQGEDGWKEAIARVLHV